MLLRNPLSCAEHAAMVDPVQFDRVQRTLDSKTCGRASAAAATPSTCSRASSPAASAAAR